MAMLLTSLRDIDLAVSAVRTASERTVRALRSLLANEADSLQVLRLMKFTELGFHPGEDRSLNLIEQVNQTFTYLVSLEAARWVLEQHPQLLAQGLRVNLGTQAGFDLESVEVGLLAGEVFAATHPRSNDKLRKDVARLAEHAPAVLHRYVFFSCPGYAPGRHPQLETVPGIELWSFPVEHLLKAAP
jgi:hypothetical protein